MICVNMSNTEKRSVVITETKKTQTTKIATLRVQHTVEKSTLKNQHRLLVAIESNRFSFFINILLCHAPIENVYFFIWIYFIDRFPCCWEWSVQTEAGKWEKRKKKNNFQYKHLTIAVAKSQQRQICARIFFCWAIVFVAN